MSGRLEGPATYSASGERQYTLKFVLTGSSGVGKTQLASRIIRGEFRERSLPTVGMEFGTRSMRYAEHSSVRAQIWDTGGKFPFKSITEAFFGGAVGAMLVYDISRRSTFDDIVRWLALIRQNCHQSISLILVGNKSDMSSKQREVSMMEGIRFARKYGLNFVETSALRDHNVEVAARQLVMSVARYLPYEKCPWSRKTPSYALPSGWVRVVVTPDGEDDENDPGMFRPNAPMPPLPPPPSQRPPLKAGNGYRVGSVVSNDSYSSSRAGSGSFTKAGNGSANGHMRGSSVPNDGSYSKARNGNANGHAVRAVVPNGGYGTAGNGKAIGHVRGSSVPNDGSYSEAGNGSANGRTVGAVVPNGSYSCKTGNSHVMGPVVPNGCYNGKVGNGHVVGAVVPTGSYSIVLYENTWTGDRYSQRPPFPAGPAEACVESQVPRAIDPLVLLADPVKGENEAATTGGGEKDGSSLKIFGRRQSWSFSSLKSKGYAAASECLSRCMEA